MTKRRRRILSALVGLAAGGSFAWFVWLAGPGETLPQPTEVARVSAPAGPLLAGASKVDFTPDRPVHIAGFGQGRVSTGTHDPLCARALVLEGAGGERVAIVALDLIGLSITDCRRVRGLVRGLPGDHVLVVTTHDHEGPDTLGFWGEAFVTSGRDDAIVSGIVEKAARAVDQAAANLRPARIRVACADVPAGVSTNIRGDGCDPRAIALAVDDAQSGAPIATLVDFAMHAEALWNKNTEFSADWPGACCAALEARRGGTAILLQGAIGGMVTVDFRDGEKGTWACADRVGAAVADTALAALATATAEPAPRLDLLRASVLVPCRNRMFNLAWRLGKLERARISGHLETEVCVLRVGSLVLAGVPGELLPRPGRRLVEGLRGASPAGTVGIIGLCDDELGYLLGSDQWDDERYGYERGWSPSSDAADLIVDRAIGLGERLFGGSGDLRK